MFMVSQVLGLRPSRAARSDTKKVPNPNKVTLSPAAIASVIVPNTLARTCSAAALPNAHSLATFSINSPLFRLSPFYLDIVPDEIEDPLPIT
jgi:hypothetical protein